MNKSYLIKKYQNDIKKRIPDEYPGKEDILQSIERNLFDFIKEHPSASFDDITAEFGLSSEVVNSFMEQLSGTEVQTIFCQKKKQKKILLIIFSICIILFIILCRYLYILYDNTPAIIEETIIIEDGQNI